MKKCMAVIVLILSPLFLFTQNEHQEIQEEILRLHHLQRDYHFQKMTNEFAESLSENAIMVNRGKVRTPSREENIRRWINYFNAVEFIQWDDTAEPKIRISEDGKMAFVVVEKKVVLDYVSELKDTIQETTQFAWVSIYERINGQWKITCNASTNQPSVYYYPNISASLDEAEIEVAEALEKFSSAYRNADIEVLSTMLTEQYVHSNSGNPIIRKKDWLKWIEKRKKSIENGVLVYSEYYNENVTIEAYGDAAVVHGVNISAGEESGKSFHKKIAFTHTWIKENGIWKRASFQDSKLP